MKLNFMLPGLYEHFQLNKLFVETLNKNPDDFYDNVNVGCFYGNFQFCAWDGGRTFSEYHPASYENIIEIRDFLLENNIPLRLIFTNPVVTEKDLDNHYCNLVAKLCEHQNNEIVVNSPILEAYLRENYPQYSFISSTTKCNSLEESLKELNRYKFICLDYNLNKQFEKIKDIKEKEKIEFLINAICPPGCPNRKEHYRLNGISHLNLGKEYKVTCQIQGNTVECSTKNYSNNITPEEIYQKYSNMGFSNFKLEGRTLSDREVILNYVYYMVKPEYQFEIANFLLAKICNI